MNSETIANKWPLIFIFIFATTSHATPPIYGPVIGPAPIARPVVRPLPLPPPPPPVAPIIRMVENPTPHPIPSPVLSRPATLSNALPSAPSPQLIFPVRFVRNIDEMRFKPTASRSQEEAHVLEKTKGAKERQMLREHYNELESIFSQIPSELRISKSEIPDRDKIFHNQLPFQVAKQREEMNCQSNPFINSFLNFFSRKKIIDFENHSDMGNVVNLNEAGIQTVHSGSINLGGKFGHLRISPAEEMNLLPHYREMKRRIASLFKDCLTLDEYRPLREKYHNDSELILMFAITQVVAEEKNKTIHDNDHKMEAIAMTDHDGDGIIELSHYFQENSFYGDCRVTSPTIALIAKSFNINPEKIFFVYVKDNMAGIFNSGHMITLYKNRDLKNPIIFDAIYMQQTGQEMALSDDQKHYIFQDGQHPLVTPHSRIIYKDIHEAREKTFFTKKFTSDVD